MSLRSQGFVSKRFNLVVRGRLEEGRRSSEDEEGEEITGEEAHHSPGDPHPDHSTRTHPGDRLAGHDHQEVVLHPATDRLLDAEEAVPERSASVAEAAERPRRPQRF